MASNPNEGKDQDLVTSLDLHEGDKYTPLDAARDSDGNSTLVVGSNSLENKEGQNDQSSAAADTPSEDNGDRRSITVGNSNGTGTDSDSSNSTPFNTGYGGYQLPAWFLARNVKTAEELRGSETMVDLTTRVQHDLETSKLKDEDQAGKKNTNQYKFQHDVYVELRDMAKSAIFSENISPTYHSQQPGILLDLPLYSEVDFLESILEQLAREVGANLISADLEDLADVAAEFFGQVNEAQNSNGDKGLHTNAQSSYGLVEAYFGICCEDYTGCEHGADCDHGARCEHRNQNEEAVSAIIDAPKGKSKSNQSFSRLSSPKRPESLPPTFFHIRDAKRIMALGKGTTILKGFQDGIRNRRQMNESVVLFASVFSDNLVSEEQDDITMKLRQTIHVDAEDVIHIAPTVREPLFRTGEAYRTREINVRRLKRALSSKFRHGFSADLLAPRTRWDQPKIETISTVLENSSWPEHTVERIARQIIGRTLGKPALELDDVCAAIQRDHHNLERKPQHPANKIRRLNKSFNEFEEDLFSCVLHPETFHTSFDDVIVAQETKETVKQLISLSNFRPTGILHRILQRVRISGILLYGPPGTGKTLLARAIAKESGAAMIYVTPAEIVSKWVGETDKYIKALFSLSSKLAPSIIFIDEADSLFRARSSEDRRHERSGVNQFLQEMDGLTTGNNSPLVIAATNRPMDLDEAFLRRLPQKFFLPLPSEGDRGRILKTFLEEDSLSPQVSMEGLARLTNGYSGSDLRTLCAQAGLILASEQMRARQTIDGARPPAQCTLDPRHFVKALERTTPSVSKHMLKGLDEFARRFNPPITGPACPDRATGGNGVINRRFNNRVKSKPELLKKSNPCKLSEGFLTSNDPHLTPVLPSKSEEDPGADEHFRTGGANTETVQPKNAGGREWEDLKEEIIETSETLTRKVTLTEVTVDSPRTSEKQTEPLRKSNEDVADDPANYSRASNADDPIQTTLNKETWSVASKNVPIIMDKELNPMDELCELCIALNPFDNLGRLHVLHPNYLSELPTCTRSIADLCRQKRCPVCRLLCRGYAAKARDAIDPHSPVDIRYREPSSEKKRSYDERNYGVPLLQVTAVVLEAIIRGTGLAVGIHVMGDHASIFGSFSNVALKFRDSGGVGPTFHESIRGVHEIALANAGQDFLDLLKAIRRRDFLKGRRVGDAVSLDLVREWLKLCDENCRSCSRTALYEPVGIPIWMIDIEKKRIVSIFEERLGTSLKYAALSYVWGTRPGLRYTANGNAEARIKSPGGLADHLDDIPLTIRDAMLLCEKLSIPYLWVDALCLNQDLDTKSAELPTPFDIMHSIYEAAYITIVAAAGHDSWAGLPGLRAGSRQCFNITELLGEVPLGLYRGATNDIISRTKWNQRAWTYQEMLLSKRLLIFTDEEVFFECDSGRGWRESIFAEHPGLQSGQFALPSIESSFKIGLDPRMGYSPTYDSERNSGGIAVSLSDVSDDSETLSESERREKRLEKSIRKLQAKFDIAYPKGKRKLNSRYLFECYTQFLTDYMPRKMTYQSDALRAIQGVLSKIESDTGTSFFNGLLLEQFHLSLLFDVCNFHSRRRRHGFPSWSWCGWNQDMATARPMVEFWHVSKLQWFRRFVRMYRYDRLFNSGDNTASPLLLFTLMPTGIQGVPISAQGEAKSCFVVESYTSEFKARAGYMLIVETFLLPVRVARVGQKVPNTGALSRYEILSPRLDFEHFDLDEEWRESQGDELTLALLAESDSVDADEARSGIFSVDPKGADKPRKAGWQWFRTPQVLAMLIETDNDGISRRAGLYTMSKECWEETASLQKVDSIKLC